MIVKLGMVFHTYEDEEIGPCPECGSEYPEVGHHNGNSYAPECYYKYCTECDHKWDPV